LSNSPAGARALKAMLDKASEKCEIAQKIFEQGYFNDASSRAYYAAFHAVSAALASKGLSYSSHAQTIGAFNREFVKTSVFPAEFSRILQRLFENRQIGDYNLNQSIGKEEAEKDLRDARRLLDACRQYLEKKTGESLEIDE